MYWYEIYIYTAAQGSWDNGDFFKKAILICNYVIEFLIYIHKNYIFLYIFNIKYTISQFYVIKIYKNH